MEIISVAPAMRLITKDFSPSCFHRASTGVENANAAPEGGIQVFGLVVFFGCGDVQPP